MNPKPLLFELGHATPGHKEFIPLPRAGVQITIFLDGIPQAIAPADLFLFLGRALAVRLPEPLEIGIRIESDGSAERVPAGEGPSLTARGSALKTTGE